MIRVYFKEVFWIHGLEDRYELEMAETVEKAEKIIDSKKGRPNIIFSGLVMPIKLDGKTVTSPEAGLSILRKVKSDPELKDIKVIIFSGYSNHEYQQEAKKLGADSYLIKHENMPEELISFVEKLTK